LYSRLLKTHHLMISTHDLVQLPLKIDVMRMIEAAGLTMLSMITLFIQGDTKAYNEIRNQISLKNVYQDLPPATTVNVNKIKELQFEIFERYKVKHVNLTDPTLSAMIQIPLEEAVALREKVTFISHKWCEDDPTCSGRLFTAMGLFGVTEYVWLDFVCAKNDIRQVITAIGLMKSWGIRTYVGPSEQEYEQSAWCFSEDAQRLARKEPILFQHEEKLRTRREDDWYFICLSVAMIPFDSLSYSAVTLALGVVMTNLAISVERDRDLRVQVESLEGPLRELHASYVRNPLGYSQKLKEFLAKRIVKGTTEKTPAILSSGWFSFIKWLYPG
jgi:hypothetical protein